MALADDYAGVFAGMKSDDDFSAGIAEKSSAFFNTKTVAVPGGGRAPVSSSPGPGTSVIKAGTTTHDDGGIAGGIANGIHAVAVAGTAGKIFSGSPAILESALNAVFGQMRGMSSGGDAAFASALAGAVTSYAGAGGMA